MLCVSNFLPLLNQMLKYTFKFEGSESLVFIELTAFYLKINNEGTFTPSIIFISGESWILVLRNRFTIILKNRYVFSFLCKASPCQKRFYTRRTIRSIRIWRLAKNPTLWLYRDLHHEPIIFFLFWFNNIIFAECI